MKRLLGLSTLTLLLAACNCTTPEPPPPPSPTPVADQTISLGQALSKPVTQSFSGTWRVTSTPNWLKVSKAEGSGNVALNVTANRTLATPVTADQKVLSGDIYVAWTSGTTTGTAHWTVTADQYALSGQVGRPAQVTASDIQLGTLSTAQADAQVGDSVIVTYRDASTRNAVLKSNLQAQSVQIENSRATLQALDISEAKREPLTARSVVLRVAATPEVLSALRADPNVQSATPSARMHALGTSMGTQALATPVVPTDQYAPLQWAFNMLGYGAVWRDIDGGAYTKPVTVAVIDTGIRYDHPDLAGKLYLPNEGALDVMPATYDGFGNGDGDGVDTDPTDPNVAYRSSGSHGTHVTGIIAANWGTFTAPCAGCSTSGVVGASYKAPIKVLPIRALNVSGNTDTPEVINAVRYAAGLEVTISGKTFTNPHPAPVINMSLGGPMSPIDAQPICDAIAEVTAKGSLVFVAGGNDGTTTPYYPAACPSAVSVASVSLSGASAPMHAQYSNAYAQVQLSAPGGTGCSSAVTVPCSITSYNGGLLNGSIFPDYILSTGWDYAKNQPKYEAESGTSQATPQVSALAALMLSKGVTTGPTDTLARLIATATDLGAAGRDPQFGYGMINPVAALNAPAISDGLGVRLQDLLGRSYQPALDALGRFTAYLGEGTYRLTAGTDTNGNGIFGESGELAVTKQADVGPEQPSVDLGKLTPQ